MHRQSAMAHRYLDGLQGIEIGGSAHNPFGLASWNVDYSGAMDTIFKEEEVRECGRALPVDVVALGDQLPFRGGSLDYVLTSHVVEHFFDPIRAIAEWHRVLKPGGLIFCIAPHKERTFDAKRDRTPLEELIARHSGEIPAPEINLQCHHSVWITEDVLELCRYLELRVVDFLDVDDKVGNGFTVVIQKAGGSRLEPFSSALGQAMHWQNTGQLEAAAQVYQQILLLQPDHSDSLHLLGVLAFQLGRPSDGLMLIEKAVQYNPRSALYHINRAKILRTQGRQADADAAYMQALGLDAELVFATA
ncbi:MAG TPA: methyltransferase domain-containing protein [Chloroflexota bacterium]